MNFLKLERVHLALAGQTLVEIDTEVDAGTVLTVMGPSGSGKSSLLAFIAGFLPPAFSASGEVWLNKRRVTALPAEQRRIGLLFQDPLLFPHMSVADNLRFALPARSPNRNAAVNASLDAVGLGGFAERDPATLSGGQKSRVALQRLLLSNPQAVLLDEPFTKLDAHLRREIRQQVFAVLRAAGLPAVLVSHDAEDAADARGPVITL
jgi:putative thiamine transport system ATP-binding protein